jgi:ankyrin repeat protein
MVINKKNIVTNKQIYNFDTFANLGLAVSYLRYGNNFNIICENIEFEDINLKDIDGWAPLYCAVRESNKYSTLETVELILKYKSNINAKTIWQNAALKNYCMFINSSSNIETLRLLLEYDANVDLVDANGETALFELIKNNNLKAIKLLLKYGVKINIKNKYNESIIDS